MTRRALVALGLLVAATATRGEMSDEDAAKKREGRYVTGLPLVNYSSDTGLGYGVRVYLYDNGARDDARFRSTPYRRQWYVQYFATTGGWQYHMASLDVPALGGSAFRLRTWAAYEADTSRSYFGVRAASTLAPPADGGANDRFHESGLTRPVGSVQLERALGAGFHALAGAMAQHARVGIYDTPVQSLLTLDAPAGIDGGWNNAARLGLVWDTRDFEPAPKRGWFAEAVGEAAGRWTGSDFAWRRLTLAARRYQGLWPGGVLAARAAGVATRGTAPFFDATTFAFTEWRTEALGGGVTLRGYQANRFVGPVAGLGNLELRQDLGEAAAGSQRFLFTLVAFGDAGRPFDSARGVGVAGWRTAAGGALRTAWNQATVINLSYGRSAEDVNVVIGFGHPF